MKILIICASNICRSPYAEYLLKRKIAEDEELSSNIEWIKSSAVMNKMRKIHPKARAALIANGFTNEEIDLHKPSYLYLDYKKFKEADIIIGMTRLHKRFLPFWFWKKFKTLSEVAGEGYVKIPDPFLESTQEKYNAVMSVIDDYIDKYIKILKNKKESI